MASIENLTAKRDKDVLDKGFLIATNPDGYLPVNLKILRGLMGEMIYPLYYCPECSNKYLVVRYFYRKGEFIPHYCCTKCNTAFEIQNGYTLKGKRIK